MEIAISKIDTKKKVEIKSGRFMVDGNTSGKLIEMRKSEQYLTELMEEVCDKMDDYAKAKYKTNGKLTVLKMMTESGMNPEMSLVDFVQDNDLNKSLKHFCLEVLDDSEMPFLNAFMSEIIINDKANKICAKDAGYCEVEIPEEEDYNSEKDEL